MDGTATDLAVWFEDAPHVGNSEHYRRSAREASELSTSERYSLATLYFSAGYFSTRQAIEIDALRYAIDRNFVGSDRDWLIAAWLSAAGRVMNAPGHSAQYLKPTNQLIADRIRRTWSRSVWELFVDRLSDLQPVGSRAWREGNRVSIGEAVDLLQSGSSQRWGAVYADPPYTKDQYSRFYHVYETLYLYDYPDSHGAARARSDRFSTKFSLASTVTEAIKSLCDSTAELELPLVLSYPSDGLLTRNGSTVQEIASEAFRRVVHYRSIPHEHSTMGGSSGPKSKSATENIYVCHP